MSPVPSAGREPTAVLLCHLVADSDLASVTMTGDWLTATPRGTRLDMMRTGASLRFR